MSPTSPTTIPNPANDAALRQYLEGFVEHLNDRIAQAKLLPPQHKSEQLDLAPHFIEVERGDDAAVHSSFSSAFDKWRGRILLLGAADAGKTTTLLQFARDKYLERLADPTKPMPVFINIRHWNSGDHWDESREPQLHDWVRKQNPTLNGLLPESEPLLYIFDGLEEMFVPFCDEYNPHRLLMKVVARQMLAAQVVISFDEQLYKKLGFETSLNGIVKLLPLETGVIQQFLETKGQRNLWQALENSPELLETARTPGVLRLLSSAVGDTEGPLAIPLGDDPRQSAFDYFIDASYRREAAKRPLEFDLATTRSLLQKLAAYLWRSGQFDSILLTLYYPQIQHQIGEKWEEFLKMAFALHFLRPVSPYAVQFVSRKFRDHCALPALLEAVNNNDLGAARSLREFEVPATLPAIFQSLKHGNSGARAGAARALAEIQAPIAVPVLLDALNDDSEYTRRYVMLALDNHRSLLTIPDLLMALNIVYGDVRKKILAMLGHFKDPATIPAILNALNDQQSELREAAVKALGELKDPAIIPAILNILNDGDNKVRAAAIQALAKFEDPLVVPAIVDVLNDEDKLVRGSAVRALGELKDPATIPALLSALNDETIRVRESAVVALSAFKNPEVIPVLLETLKDESHSVRLRTAIKLGEFDAQIIVPVLLNALNEENIAIRSGAVKALGKTNDPATIPAILNALHDEAKVVRSGSLKALEWCRDLVSTSDLLNAMNSEYNDVRAGVLELIRYRNDSTSLPAILNALQDEDFIIRSGAVRRLGDFNEPATFPAIVNALQDENEHVRHNAARTFRIIKYPPSIPALINALNDENKDVRYNAVMGLGNLKDPTTIPALLQVLEESVNEWSEGTGYMCTLVAEALEKFQTENDWYSERPT